MTTAIEVLNVSKVYRRYARKRQFATLKSAILDGSLLGDERANLDPLLDLFQGLADVEHHQTEQSHCEQ